MNRRYTAEEIDKRYEEWVKVNGRLEDYEAKMDRLAYIKEAMAELQDEIDLLFTRIKHKDYDPTEKKTHGWTGKKRGN